MKPISGLRLQVSSIRAEARDVISLELRDPNGGLLPAFTPGAHVEVSLAVPGGGRSDLIRHYSLCNDSRETSRYEIAVGLAAPSRGGSAALHTIVKVGALLDSSAPRNNFALVSDAACYRFIAGGIGITPILSMIRWCAANNRDWSLLYCARNRLRAAFYEELKAFESRVQFHFDDESDRGFVDFSAELVGAPLGEHIYCCGPEPLMRAVEVASSGRSVGTVHFEWFAPSSKDFTEESGVPSPFEVVLRRRGVQLSVPSHRSILEVLEENEIFPPFSCREGLCRTCETGLLSGTADHRDMVLSQEERAAQRSIMICVSRCKAGPLELDL